MELQPVPRCPVCGAEDRVALHRELRDPQLPDRPERFDIVRCTSCGTAHLDPRPTDATLGEAYASSYYTHTQPAIEEPSPAGAAAKFRRALRNGHIKPATATRSRRRPARRRRCLHSPLRCARSPSASSATSRPAAACSTSAAPTAPSSPTPAKSAGTRPASTSTQPRSQSVASTASTCTTRRSPTTPPTTPARMTRSR